MIALGYTKTVEVAGQLYLSSIIYLSPSRSVKSFTVHKVLKGK